MWILRAYDKQTDELEHELPLQREIKREQFRQLGVAHADPAESTPVSRLSARRLAMLRGARLGGDAGWEYRLEFDPGSRDVNASFPRKSAASKAPGARL